MRGRCRQAQTPSAGEGSQLTSLTSTGQLTNRAHLSGNTHWGPAIPDLPYSVAILEPQNVIHLLWRAFLRALQVGLSKSLQEGLPAPLPRTFRAVRGPKPRPKPKRPDWLAGLSSQAASNSTIGLIRRLKSTSISFSKEMAMIGALAGWPLARPPLRFARGDSSTLTAHRGIRTSDRGFGAHQAWRTGKRQSVSHNP